MNQLFIFAKFDEMPSAIEISQIKKEISDFLLKISSEIKLEIKTGEGSWWILITGFAIPIGGWILRQFAEYAIQECFDKGKEKLIESKPVALSGDGQLLTSNDNQLKQPSYNSESTIGLLRALDSKGVPLKEMVMSEYSDKNQKFYCDSFTKTEEGYVVRRHITDSKDDFDSYLSRIIDHK